MDIITGYSNDKLVSSMIDFFVFYAIEENGIWIAFKRTTYTTSGSDIGQQIVGICEQEHIVGKLTFRF